MFDFETTVSGIEYKVRQLSDEVQRLRASLTQSQHHCLELQEEIYDKDKIIKQLTEENRIVKLGNRLNEGNDSAELKLKISQNIRAIDRCLELLKREESMNATERHESKI